MDFMQRLVALERRLARVEANRGASLRFGTVTESNQAGSARVQLHDGDDMVSHPVRTLHKRTLKDQDLCLPDVGEQVAVLFSGQGLEQGCVLGAVYSRCDAAPGAEQPTQFYRFEDGTTIAYDRVNHTFVADIKGKADIVVQESSSITIKKDATVNVEGSAIVEAQKDVVVRSQQNLILEGGAGIVMRGPSIYFEGMDGESCQASIHADLSITGQMALMGNLNQQGSQSIAGSVSASGVVQGNPVVGCPH